MSNSADKHLPGVDSPVEHSLQAKGTTSSNTGSPLSLKLNNLSPRSQASENRCFSLAQIRSMLKEDPDRLLIIYRAKVYDVTKFGPYHPGGLLAMHAMNGRDCTDVMVAFHPPAVITKKLPHYYLGDFVVVDSEDEDNMCADVTEVSESSPTQISAVNTAEKQSSIVPSVGNAKESLANPLQKASALGFSSAAVNPNNLVGEGVNGSLSGESFSATTPSTVDVPNLLSSSSRSSRSSSGSSLADSSSIGAVIDSTAVEEKKESPHVNQQLIQLMASQSPITAAYLELNEKFRKMGFYEPKMSFYYRQWSFFAAWFSVAIGLVIFNPNSVLAVCVSAAMMGVFWHGLSFCTHDAGHHSVSGDRKQDDLIGAIMASYFGGLSVTWWQTNHNVHHLVTNEPEHDPDIQHLPLFAVSTRFFENLYSSFHRRQMNFDGISRVLVSIQHYLFLPIMTVGRFNLYAQSLNHLLSSHPDGKHMRWFELAGIGFFWLWYGYGLLGCVLHASWKMRLLYLWISHAATAILHLQITLSHFAMSTRMDDEFETFAEKALRTTMNVDCPEWFDWFHGGLQFQIEHHLFPKIPRIYFRRMRPMVKQFCKDHNLEYHEHTFVRGNGKVLSLLAEIASQVKFVVIDSAQPEKRFVN